VTGDVRPQVLTLLGDAAGWSGEAQWGVCGWVRVTLIPRGPDDRRVERARTRVDEGGAVPRLPDEGVAVPRAA
jgi:hypothetical protein